MRSGDGCSTSSGSDGEGGCCGVKWSQLVYISAVVIFGKSMRIAWQVSTLEHSNGHRRCSSTGSILSPKSTVQNAPDYIHPGHGGPVHEVTVPVVGSSCVGAVACSVYFADGLITLARNAVGITTLVVKITVVLVAVFVLRFNQAVAVKI